MTNPDYRRYQGAKSSLKSIISYASKKQDISQDDLQVKTNGFIQDIYKASKSTPKYLGAYLRQYLDGLLDGIIAPEIVFLYKIDGVFYRISSNKFNVDLKFIDDLPRGIFSGIAEFGDLYWRKTLKPYYIR